MWTPIRLRKLSGIRTFPICLTSLIVPTERALEEALTDRLQDTLAELVRDSHLWMGNIGTVDNVDF